MLCSIPHAINAVETGLIMHACQFDSTLTAQSEGRKETRKETWQKILVHNYYMENNFSVKHCIDSCESNSAYHLIHRYRDKYLFTPHIWWKSLHCTCIVKWSVTNKSTTIFFSHILLYILWNLWLKYLYIIKVVVT